MIVYFPVEHITEAVSLLATLRAQAVPLTFVDGTSRIWVTPIEFGDHAAPDVAARIEAAGFVAGERWPGIVWTLETPPAAP